jgi:hypothetical protein
MEWFDLLLGAGVMFIAFLLFMIEDNIEYSRKVIDKDKNE